MRLDVSRAFVTEGFLQPFTASLSFPAGLTDKPLDGDVAVRGTLQNRAGVLSLTMDVSYVLKGGCDRCCEEVRRTYETAVSVLLVREKQDEENDDLIEVAGDFFEIDDLISESVLLSAPAKFLCKEDCRGLCPLCGQNLNVKNCDCRQTHSPFDRLKQDYNS